MSFNPEKPVVNQYVPIQSATIVLKFIFCYHWSRLCSLYAYYTSIELKQKSYEASPDVLVVPILSIRISIVRLWCIFLFVTSLNTFEYSEILSLLPRFTVSTTGEIRELTKQFSDFTTRPSFSFLSLFEHLTQVR